MLDSGSKVNAITPAYAAKIDLRSRPTNVGAQKIDGSALANHDMALASFSLQDSQGRVGFFEEIFLLADTSMKIVLGMPFLAFNKADVEFTKLGKLIWRSYTAAEALPTTSWVKLIDKREFAKSVFDENSKTFVVHVATLEAETLIHPSRTAQIAALQWDKAPT